MSQNQPEPEEDDEAELPGSWLFGMLADMGMLGPEVEEEDLSEEEG